MLPETVAALAEKREVAVAHLFEFQFRSATKRFWTGLGLLPAGGKDWEGSADIISVSGMSQLSGTTANPVTFRLSGTTPDLINAALQSEVEVTGRPCAVFIQFLQSRRVPLDSPIAIWSGTMDVLSFDAGATDQSLSLSAETLMVNRIRAPYGLMTDTDQQARWPGDRGFEFMPKLRNKTVNWLRG